MSEGPKIDNRLEQEIAALSAAINEKKAALERERGSSVEVNEALHHVVSEKVYGGQIPSTNAQSPNNSQTSSSNSYLDNLDPADAEKINSYIDLIPTQGLQKTIDKVKSESAYLLDAFHDALVDKLKSELKSQKLI